jgi:hypothetical protein
MKYSKTVLFLVCLSLTVLLTQSIAGETKYKDVTVSHWAYSTIESLTKTGIITGFSDNTFKPYQRVTREQFAVILIKTLNLRLDQKAAQTFSDVNPNRWSFLYIDASKSFIPTYYNPKGTFNFNPMDVITYEEVAESIVLALNLDKNPKAAQQMLTDMFKDYEKPNRLFDAKDNLTRAELTVIMNKLLKDRQQEEKKNEKPVAPQKQPTSIVTQKPWTISFMDFKRPDYEMVKNYPGYNIIQSFFGAVTSKVYGYGNYYLVLEHRTLENHADIRTSVIKTVNMYVYEQDLQWFFPGDMLLVHYDRNNNITSYSFETEAKPHPFKPPVKN